MDYNSKEAARIEQVLGSFGLLEQVLLFVLLLLLLLMLGVLLDYAFGLYSV